MTDHLTSENKALVERVLGYGTARTYNRDEIDRIIEAARTEGRESRPSGIRPGDIDWLERCKDAGHCGDGSLESKARHDHNERIDRLLSALSPSVEDPAWRPDREAVARLIHFMHGDGLSAEDAMRPSNDAHWNFWKDDPPHADAWKAADAILSLVPSQGKAVEGWVLVPKDPTEAMLDAPRGLIMYFNAPPGESYPLGKHAQSGGYGERYAHLLTDREKRMHSFPKSHQASLIYRAMIAAAPAQPGGGE